MGLTFEELRKQVETMAQGYRMNPELIAELLQFKSQFYRYSLRNTMAIKSQNPYATFVASFRDWKEKGYSVRKGEKCLYVWTPVRKRTFYRSENEPSVTVAKATPEEKQKIATGVLSVKEKLTFRLGSVFDISQTTCPPEDYPKVYSMGYPDMEHKTLYEQLQQFAEKSGFPVRVEDVQSISLGGYYSPATDEIVLSDKLDDTRRLAVLCHELSHGLMHKNSTQPKAVVEFEAEGLAIMLLTKMGLPVSDQNKQYVSGYYQKIDQEQYNLDQSFARMQDAYNFVVQSFEQELAAPPQEETIEVAQKAEQTQDAQQNELVSQERIAEMEENFWTESNDPETEEWRNDLTPEELQIVDAWDNRVADGMSNMGQAILTLQARELPQRLFVDMDGTLAEFKHVDQLETLYEPGYFANLKPMDKVVKAVREIHTNHPEIEVHILSAYLSDSPHALTEKNQWLDEHLPEIDAAHRVFVPCGTDKKAQVPGGIRPTDFLLDDYTHNLSQWQPPARGIKLMNGINHTKGTWQGDRIHFDHAPAELAEKIVSVMKGQMQIQENNPAKEELEIEQPKTSVKPPKRKHNKYTPEQIEAWKQQQKEELQQLKRDVQILDYAKDHGYNPKKIGNRYYELAEHGSMRIDPVRNCFFYNAGSQQGSIVDFIKFANPGMNEADAIQALKEYAGVPGRSITPTPKAAAPQQTEQRPFSLPERLEGKYSRLYAYLTKTRRIDFEVVSHLVKRDMLYEDQRHNCVFAGYDQEGVAQYAGLRTTHTEGNFKGEAPGSSKDISWYVRNGAKSLFVTEAPIDAMSVMTLFKLNGVDFRNFDYLSLGGVGPNALLHHIQENPQIQRIFLGLDKDEAGKTGSERIKEVLQAIGFPGKIIDKVPGRGKDWNQELCILTDVMRQEKAMRKNLEQAIER